MQTVSFQCGHCHKVMGVSSAFLGKQVRCPHCQQVVLAPAQVPVPAAAAPPRPPTPQPFSVPNNRDEHESIFGEHVDDDLFGSAPKPTVEIPPELPRNNNLQLEPTVFTVPGIAPGLQAPPTDPMGLVPPMPAGRLPTPSNPGDMHVPSTPSAAVMAPGEIAANVPTPAPFIQAPVRRMDSSNMVPIYILIFLAPYAIFITAIAIYYYVQWRNIPSPLEMLPDIGEPKSKKGPRTQVIQRIPASTELSANLRVPLGKTFRIGDLEVTPKKVEQKRLVFKARLNTDRSDKVEEDSLVLHLDFKNVSKDTIFRPTDSAFDYRWTDKVDPESTMPYTYLNVAGIRYCGPFTRTLLHKRVREDDNLRDEYVVGQEGDTKVLNPGETSSTVIATEPKDQVPNSLRAHKGKLVWRVHLRRGLVKTRDGEKSATFVMGVEFDKEQIEKVDK